MKTQIVQLQPNDDIVSVKDRMSWCQTGRILLVWPLHGRVLTRQLDLVLAKRYAVSLGSELALVTHDVEVKSNAGLIGIPVFTEIRQAQEQEWGMSQPERVERFQRSHLPGLDNLRKSIQAQTPAWMEQPAAKIVCVGISLLAILALAIFILPGARVTLTPREEMQSIQLDLIADPSATSINLSTGSLPTYSQEVSVEGSDWITATGILSIPEEPASGMLEFTNNTRKPMSLPARTIVTTLGDERIRFETSNGSEVVIKPNKSVLVEAKAVKPGTSGNLPPDSLVTIEGDMSLQLAVTNPEATRGGLDAYVPTTSEQDRHNLHARLTARLLQDALSRMRLNLPDGDILIPTSAAITDIIEETYSPEAGAPTKQAELTMRLKIKAQAVRGEALRNLATPILNANVPAGYQPLADTLIITPLGEPVMSTDGKASWSVTASRKLLADLPSSKAILSIKGVTHDMAVERLAETLPLAEPAKIELSPRWWPILPLLAMRIQVDTQ